MSIKKNNTNTNKQNGRNSVKKESARSLPPTRKRPHMPKTKPSKANKSE